MRCINKMSERKILPIFSELGSNNSDTLSLDKIKSDRRELDKFIMGQILNLSDEEQLEVYRAAVDLIRSRIDKAASVKIRKRKEKFSTNIEQIKDIVLHELDVDYLDQIKDFDPKNFDCTVLDIEKSKDIEIKVDLNGTPKLKSGEQEIEFDTLKQAQYARFMMLMGQESVLIPVDTQVLNNILSALSNLDKHIKEKLNSILNLLISDKNIKESIRNKIYILIWENINKTYF